MVFQPQLDRYRNRTFHFLPQYHLHSERDAIHFINKRNFVFFWPVKNVLLPSLWGATVGNRPVPNNHDDPGHITWRWKDNLLGKRKCYYGRVLRKRNTFISLEALPNFYALSPNYGDPENDYLVQYQQGLLSVEAKNIFEALLNEGMMDSLSLRKAVRLLSPRNESRFNRALEILQADFRILPVGIAAVGTWKYAFVYDTVHHHFPNLIEKSHHINISNARCFLLEAYIKSIGACTIEVLRKLFRWGENEMMTTLSDLLYDKRIAQDSFFLEKYGQWYLHPDFMNSL